MLESGSWGHSVLQTPALVTFKLKGMLTEGARQKKEKKVEMDTTTHIDSGPHSLHPLFFHPNRK